MYATRSAASTLLVARARRHLEALDQFGLGTLAVVGAGARDAHLEDVTADGPLHRLLRTELLDLADAAAPAQRSADGRGHDDDVAIAVHLGAVRERVPRASRAAQRGLLGEIVGLAKPEPGQLVRLDHRIVAPVHVVDEAAALEVALELHAREERALGDLELRRPRRHVAVRRGEQRVGRQHVHRVVRLQAAEQADQLASLALGHRVRAVDHVVDLGAPCQRTVNERCLVGEHRPRVDHTLASNDEQETSHVVAPPCQREKGPLAQKQIFPISHK